MNKTDLDINLKDGRKLGFAEYGHSIGFPIIYCHGSQSSRIEMHYDMSFAIENNLRIITIDRPGHGLSDFNPKGSILSFAKDVKELTEYLNINEPLWTESAIVSFATESHSSIKSKPSSLGLR